MFIRNKKPVAYWLGVSQIDISQVGAYATGLSCCPSVIKINAVRMVVL